MGEIVKFTANSERIEYDNILLNDPYLRTTALNALSSAGYRLNKQGVIQFHIDNNRPPTGWLGISDFDLLIIQFDDPETRQEIINYVAKKRDEYMSNKNKKKPSYLSIILTLGGIAFFELYGIVSCFFDIYHHFVK